MDDWLLTGEKLLRRVGALLLVGNLDALDSCGFRADFLRCIAAVVAGAWRDTAVKWR